MKNMKQRGRSMLGNESHKRGIPGQQESAVLAPMSTQVVGLLEQARKIGPVVLLTNGSSHWACVSLQYLMPQVHAFVSENEIPVICAAEQMSNSDKATLPIHDYWKQSRLRAFRKAVSSAGPPSKHGAPDIVSVGDPTLHTDALEPFTQEDTVTSRHFKTVLGGKDPGPHSIARQAAALTKWLPDIVRATGNIHIQLPATER